MEPIIMLAEFAVIVYLAYENRSLKTAIPKRDKSGKFAPKVKISADTKKSLLRATCPDQNNDDTFWRGRWEENNRHHR
jgi:hypothetical protein